VSDDLDLVGRVRLDTSGLHEGVSAISSSLGKIGALAAGAFAVDKLVSWGKAGIGVAADMQQTSISFETMLGSGQKAQAFLKDLRAFAAATPFEFPELATAASSLISVGIETSKVIPIMTTLGNVTSGMGTGSDGVKRATVALQQMNAAGRITGEDLNQLRDAGIPVYDLLAGAIGKSKEEVAKLAQNGKLGKKELDLMMGALESGKGLERFNGLMQKQSQTLNGVISPSTSSRRTYRR
jgi:tape measure domain-containing protein